MPSKFDQDDLFSQPTVEEDSFAREERCRKALNTVGKAIFMRLFVVVLLILVAVKAQTSFAVVLMLLLVLVINLSGMLPLVKEWKARKAELNQILDEE